MPTANANIFVMLEKDTTVKELQVVPTRYRRLTRKRNFLIFAVTYGIALAVVLKLLFL